MTLKSGLDVIETGAIQMLGCGFLFLFDFGKTSMIGLPYGEKNYDDMLSCFYTIPACHGRTIGRTDGRTDRQTELLYQYRAAMC